MTYEQRGVRGHPRCFGLCIIRAMQPSAAGGRQVSAWQSDRAVPGPPRHRYVATQSCSAASSEGKASVRSSRSPGSLPKSRAASLLDRTTPVGSRHKATRADIGRRLRGTELATRLSETTSDGVDVTLLDRNDSFFFGFSKLDVMLGRQSADVLLPYRDLQRTESSSAGRRWSASTRFPGGWSPTSAPTTPTSWSWRWVRTTTWRPRPAWRRGATSTTRSLGQSAFAMRLPTSMGDACSCQCSGSRQVSTRAI